MKRVDAIPHLAETIAKLDAHLKQLEGRVGELVGRMEKYEAGPFLERRGTAGGRRRTDVVRAAVTRRPRPRKRGRR